MSENLQQRPVGYRDPRTALVQDKYFTLRPKPLEHWLWRQGLPQAAERVFWVHWEEGMRAGDWCSQLSLRRVAALCCVDPSTVTRAYQQLKSLGLINREDPGRDPANPFQQATAVTEVRVPRELLAQLHLAPNRHAKRSAVERGAGGTQSPPTSSLNRSDSESRDSDERAPSAAAAVTGEGARPPDEASAAPAEAPEGLPHLKYRDYQRIMAKFSEREKAAYTRAWADRTGTMTFEAGTALEPLEQRHVLHQLQMAAEPPKAPKPAQNASQNVPGGAYGAGRAVAPHDSGPRRLTPLEAARLRKRLLDALPEALPAADASETFRQMCWAVEEGSLRRFETAMAINIALKKLREGVWTRPNRMPPQWRDQGRLAGAGTGVAAIGSTPAWAPARTETCSAA